MQHPLSDTISTNEEAFILRALESGLRVDGRRLLEARPLRVEFGAGSGACEVRLGQTSVLATATAELVEPYPDRAAEGLLQFFVEFSPMASPVFEPGRPSEPAVELMRLLERTIRKSQAIDLEALCVVASKRVWSVRCDITVTDHRGNLTDAAVLAALAALRHLRLPGVAVSGNGDDAEVEVLSAECAEPQPLVFHHTPVAASLAFFRGAEGGAPLVLLDPSDREELVMLGSLVVVLNQHDELCALHKPGGLPLAPAQLLECVREAAAAVQPMREALETALALHHQQLQARAAALAKTGRVPTQREPPGDAAVSVSVPAALEGAPPPLAARARGTRPCRRQPGPRPVRPLLRPRQRRWRLQEQSTATTRRRRSRWAAPWRRRAWARRVPRRRLQAVARVARRRVAAKTRSGGLGEAVSGGARLHSPGFIFLFQVSML